MSGFVRKGQTVKVYEPMPKWCVFVVIWALLLLGRQGGAAIMTGEGMTWHTLTFTFEGPETSEGATPNPFLDYRLTVTFANEGGGATYAVPGYYAADGNAGQSGAAAGNKWRVHFCPDREGFWAYNVSFRKGVNVAVSDDPAAGESGGFMDGRAGSFRVSPTDKKTPDLRGRGRLRYVGKRYLQFAQTKEYFLKCGADAPENFLAYADFDGDFKTDGHNDQFVKTWQPHVQDWKDGDPTWQNGKGKGIIGALNYLAAKGMNAFSFLTMNIEGDDQNVFPYIGYEARDRMDCSKLDQWETVFAHADTLGLHLHFKTQETENDQLLDGGELGVQRKLYYRELIARFGHHLALNWNLGEENTNTTEQRVAFARYFHEHDPYGHPIVVHTFPEAEKKQEVYPGLLGERSLLTGVSLQCHPEVVFSDTKEWVERSAAAGRPWVVACDEQGSADVGVKPDRDDPGHDIIRKQVLWGNLMAGGAGVEYYFGYKFDESDLTCQDYRSRDRMWELSRYALDFFRDNDISFTDMVNDNDLSTNADDYCFYRKNLVYVVYLKNGGGTKLNLTEAQERFDVTWFNPRTGQFEGGVRAVQAGGLVDLGAPPADPGQDWVILVRKPAVATPSNIKRPDLGIRDPFVLADPATKTYYMYKSMGVRLPDGKSRGGVGVYTSKDLQTWRGPTSVFHFPDGSWADRAVWAPEVHPYKGKYYLFATFTSADKLPTPPGRPENVKRATQILVADSPLGPFEPFANQPHTPADWMSLDGTLWVEDGVPYLIFCHEWIQVTDGTMELVRLKDDLSAVVGKPQTLFKATDGTWVRSLGQVGAAYQDQLYEGYVTDGPFLYRTKTGRLLMIWSSFGEQKYAVAMAYSTTGKVAGPWVQIQEPLFKANGGHGMIFTSFDGKLILSLHQPNTGNERAHFFELEDAGDALALKRELPFFENPAYVGRTPAEQVMIERQPIADLGDAYFRNPVGHGGDLAAIRVGDDFYLARSGNVDIFHSRDLVNWQKIGQAVSERLGNPWAPELVYVKGRFYVYVTFAGSKLRNDSHFINVAYTTTDPAGRWDGPYDLHVDGLIDPGHIEAQDGRRFLLLEKGYIIELAPDGLSTIGELKKMYEGWPIPNDWVIECFCLEGPKMIYKDGYYYYGNAQGGTSGPKTSHMGVIARAKYPTGPWENSPYNPLVHTYSPDEEWLQVGHATILDDPRGDWWVLVKGTSKTAGGRHTLLMPLEWTADGWPRIPLGLKYSDVLLKPMTAVQSTGIVPLSDDFLADTLGPQWTTPENAADRFSVGGGALRVKAQGAAVRDAAPLTCKPTNKAFEVDVEIDIPEFAEAGILIGQNVGFGLKRGGVVNYSRGQLHTQGRYAGHRVWLKLRNMNGDLALFFSEDGQKWTQLERGLTGGRSIGLFAVGEGEVVFRHFRYRGLD